MNLLNCIASVPIAGVSFYFEYRRNDPTSVLGAGHTFQVSIYRLRAIQPVASLGVIFFLVPHRSASLRFILLCCSLSNLKSWVGGHLEGLTPSTPSMNTWICSWCATTSIRECQRMWPSPRAGSGEARGKCVSCILSLTLPLPFPILFHENKRVVCVNFQGVEDRI